jgi:hypothetical protein
MDMRSAIAAFCVVFLNVAGANAQEAVLECLFGGEQPIAPYTIDATKKTMNTGKGAVPAELDSHRITWNEEGVLWMINRDTGAIFRRLPDGSFFQVGECRPREK